MGEVELKQNEDFQVEALFSMRRIRRLGKLRRASM